MALIVATNCEGGSPFVCFALQSGFSMNKKRKSCMGVIKPTSARSSNDSSFLLDCGGYCFRWPMHASRLTKTSTEYQIKWLENYSLYQDNSCSGMLKSRAEDITIIRLTLTNYCRLCPLMRNGVSPVPAYTDQQINRLMSYYRGRVVPKIS